MPEVRSEDTADADAVLLMMLEVGAENTSLTQLSLSSDSKCPEADDNSIMPDIRPEYTVSIQLSSFLHNTTRWSSSQFLPL